MKVYDAASIRNITIAGHSGAGKTQLAAAIGDLGGPGTETKWYVDTGPILSQRSIPISSGDTGGSLFAKMAPIGADLLLETLPRYLAGELVPQPQPASRTCSIYHLVASSLPTGR